MSLKNPVTPTGIDPGTVRLVAQRLNLYATPGPGLNYYLIKKSRHIDYMNGLGLANKNGVSNRILLINAQGVKRQKIFKKVLVRVGFYFNWFAATNVLKLRYKKLKHKI
jgi:hypothetical protein